jgi:hypothetical protein
MRSVITYTLRHLIIRIIKSKGMRW